MSRAAAANAALRLATFASRARISRALDDPSVGQRASLSEALRCAAGTHFARQHGLTKASPYPSFARQVPLADYGHYQSQIDAHANGRQRVLTSEPIRRFERTSGSTGGAKLIPITTTFLKQFQRTVNAWLNDLHGSYPGVSQGRAYWSLSPLAKSAERTAGGIAIGLEDDTEYLGRLERFVTRHALVRPVALDAAETARTFRRNTLAELLCAPDLALISVWSPTFLLGLLDELENQEALLREVHDRDAARAVSVERILRDHDGRADHIARLWPHLALISCWADAGAERHARNLSTIFPNVAIQPKGLLSTEAVVSVPLRSLGDPVLAVTGHFLEFLPAEDVDRSIIGTARPCLRVGELEVGRRYVPIVTTGGGLYRYVTGDIVAVTGRVGETEQCRFVGRWDDCVDLVGEKLFEGNVSDLKRDLEVTLGAELSVIVAPDTTSDRPSYVFVVGLAQREDGHDFAQLSSQLRDALADSLSKNPYYEHAKAVGQLGDEQIAIVATPDEAWRIYERACVRVGQRLGDIKPTSLSRREDIGAIMIDLVEEGTGVVL